jgi:hypothetical protein
MVWQHTGPDPDGDRAGSHMYTQATEDDRQDGMERKQGTYHNEKSDHGNMIAHFGVGRP